VSKVRLFSALAQKKKVSLASICRESADLAPTMHCEICYISLTILGSMVGWLVGWLVDK
jgi:hypothetical protein